MNGSHSEIPFLLYDRPFMIQSDIARLSKTRRQEDKKTRRQEDKKTRRQEDKKTRRQRREYEESQSSTAYQAPGDSLHPRLRKSGPLYPRISRLDPTVPEKECVQVEKGPSPKIGG
jgi:hypothetical protein